MLAALSNMRERERERVRRKQSNTQSAGGHKDKLESERFVSREQSIYVMLS